MNTIWQRFIQVENLFAVVGPEEEKGGEAAKDTEAN